MTNEEKSQLREIVGFFQENPAKLETSAKKIEIIETHISIVLLTETFVYKFKKSVDLGFISQDTFEKRKENCDREAKLNSRLAADVYLGVLGVHLAGEGYVLGPVDKSIEPCVKMRRLDNTRTLLELTKTGTATQPMIVRIAQTIAAFHAVAERGPQVSSFHDFEKNLNDNLNDLEQITFFAEARLRIRIMEVYGQARRLIARRKKRLKIIDGHGDLRLDHIYVYDDAIRVIDCVEFNAALRAVDPWEDLAFATMALRNHSRDDLADHLLAAYATHSLDFQGLGLLNIFEIYRATVRAKIDRISLSLGREEYRERMLSYLQLTDRLLLESKAPPTLHIVFGLPATGKTTVATRMSKELRCPVISTDRVRKQFYGKREEERNAEKPFQGLYGARETDRTYARTLAMASICLKAGYSVIVDGTFSREKSRIKARAIAERQACKIQFTLVEAPESVIRQRLAERKASASLSDLVDFETWLEVKKRFEPL